jgi:putative transposase
MTPPPDPHYRHRFPAEIISHAVWLYHVFSLSLRDVELILVERGVAVSYETGATLVQEVRCKFRQPPATPPATTWRQVAHGRGLHPYPGRAALSLARRRSGWRCARHILVQARRDAQAAARFFKRLLKGLQYEPRVIVTDKLRSYGVAQRQLLPGVEHRQSRYLNNRAENSHRPTRRRERQMQRFKSSRHAPDFLSAHSFIYGHSRPRRHLLPAPAYREIRSHAFNVWQQETCARNAA